MIALVLASLTLSQTPAAATRSVIILGGGAAKADAQAVLDKYAAWPFKGITPAAGHPRAVRSDEVAGLKPGFEIAILGACDDKATAEALRDLVAMDIAGVYVREVPRSGAEACPALVGAHVQVADAARVSARAAPSSVELVTTSTSLVDDAGYGYDDATACGVKVLNIDLVVRGTSVAHDKLVDCETLCGNEGEPRPDEVCGTDTKEWTVDDRVVVGERAFLALVEEEGHTRTRGKEPAAKSRWHLYGFACGALRDVLSVNAPEGRASDVFARAARGKSDAVVVDIPRVGAGAKTKTVTFTWSDATCSFLLL